MIDDNEMRELFRVESEERLQSLERGLLTLESNPADSSALESVFREAHSLKGSARLLGVKNVEIVAHRMEDILSAVRKGSMQLTREIATLMYRGIDALQKFIHEAVTGENPGIGVADVLNFLNPAATSSNKENISKAKESSSAESPAPPSSEMEAALEAYPSQDSAAPGSEYRLDTIRVRTSRLDELLTRAGELIVIKTRMAHRVSQMEDALSLWEELSRLLPSMRLSPDTLAPEKAGRLESLLSALKDDVTEDNSRLDMLAVEIDQSIRGARLLPFSTIFNLFPRMVRDMALEKSSEAALRIEGGETTADKRIIEEMKDPLVHLVRNAIDHGLESPDERERAGKPRSGTITLRAFQRESSVVIEVSDDGRGLDMEAIKRAAVKRGLYGDTEAEPMTSATASSLIFSSGFSTSSFITDISGRGVGLDVVRSRVEGLKGFARVESVPGAGMTISLSLPLAVSSVRALIVSANGASFAIPMEYVISSMFVASADIFPIEGRQTINFGDRPVSVASLADLLEMNGKQKTDSVKAGRNGASRPCVTLQVGEDVIGVMVDSLVDEQEVTIKPHGGVLKRVRNVAGYTILGSGEVCTVLNPADMAISISKSGLASAARKAVGTEVRKLTVLLVEDSITTRTQEKRILEGAGYEVVTAVDGMDALAKLSARQFHAIVSDIMMPNMDGLTLTAKIREDKKRKDMPIILVTTLASDEDKAKGLEAGANAYMPKPTFDQKMFLETLKRLV